MELSMFWKTMIGLWLIIIVSALVTNTVSYFLIRGGKRAGDISSPFYRSSYIR